MPYLVLLSSATRACLEELIEQRLRDPKSSVRLSAKARARIREELAELTEPSQICILQAPDDPGASSGSTPEPGSARPEIRWRAPRAHGARAHRVGSTDRFF